MSKAKAWEFLHNQDEGKDPYPQLTSTGLDDAMKFASDFADQEVSEALNKIIDWKIKKDPNGMKRAVEELKKVIDS